MGRFLEIILMVLILRTVLSMVLPHLKQNPGPPPMAPKSDADHFGKKADIVDGEFEDLK